MYPALAVVDELKLAQQAGSPLAVVWVGSAGGMEGDIVRRAGIPFYGLRLRGGMRGMGPLVVLSAAWGLLRGFFQALRIIRREKPAAILVTGGYVSAPTMLAGWLLRVPGLMYLPDMAPGWAVRFLAPFTRRIAVTAEESRRFFKPGKVLVTGYPVRPSLFGQERAAARAAFGLEPETQTVLVMGGSRGAHSINAALVGALPHLLPFYQIIHVTGQREAALMRDARDELPERLRPRYRYYGFLHDDMPKAFAAADLIVCRAGASVLGEIPAAGLAAVLAPYVAGHRDQEQNAAFLCDKGAAVCLDDATLSASILEETINQILGDPARLNAMQQASTALAKPDAAGAIARELASLAAR